MDHLIDAWTRRPGLDYIVLVVPIGFFFWWPFDLVSKENYSDLALGVSTLGGLLLAAATFICTLTYQSTSASISKARARFDKELRKNWSAIILGAFHAALLPLIGIGVLDRSLQVATLAVLAGVSMIIARTWRALFWLRNTLFLDSLDAKYGEVGQVQEP